MMREQLLKCESPLCRVAAGGELGQARFTRRTVQLRERFLERGQPERREDMRRNPVAHRGGIQFAQRLRDECAQAALRHAFGAGINRCQALLERGGTGAQAAILRMHHLDSEGSAAHLPKAAHARAARKALLLRKREIEEAQREKAGAVADARDHLTAFAVRDFGEEHLALDRRAHAGDERAERRELRAILVAQRQDKQQILHLRDSEALETLGERSADAGQRRHRPLLSACGGMARGAVSQDAGCRRFQRVRPAAVAQRRR